MHEHCGLLLPSNNLHNNLFFADAAPTLLNFFGYVAALNPFFLSFSFLFFICLHFALRIFFFVSFFILESVFILYVLSFYSRLVLVLLFFLGLELLSFLLGCERV